MKSRFSRNASRLLIGALLFGAGLAPASAKDAIVALYLPIIDHYPLLLSHLRYSKQMSNADFSVLQMAGWNELRQKFESGEADIAVITAPLALDMYAAKPMFQTVALAHRNGSALSVNTAFAKSMANPRERAERRPDEQFAKAAKAAFDKTGNPLNVGVPTLHSAHTLVLYKYMKDQGINMVTPKDRNGVLVVRQVPPPKSAEYLKAAGALGQGAATIQAQPWGDIFESSGTGTIAWYSKDVMKHPKGHVDCIIIASANAIKNKRAALAEVIESLHKGGAELQAAIQSDNKDLLQIATSISEVYIPGLKPDVIAKSMSKDIGAINFNDLNVDMTGLKQLQDLGMASGFQSSAVDLDKFSDRSFAYKKK
jgi:NitT/TauT family transport system substrate-binding protein